MNNSIVFAIGPRLFIPAEKKSPVFGLNGLSAPTIRPRFRVRGLSTILVF